MTLLESIVLGIVQGLTEFLPISSTAHLLVGEHLLGIPSSDLMFAYLVLIQLGTLLSLIALFWKELLALLRAFFARPLSTAENRLAWYLILATIPAALAGFLLRDAVEHLFRQPLLEAAVRLLSAALLLVLAERLGQRSRRLDSLSALDALIIGLFQVLSIFPGASRSGTTISGGMLRGLDRPAAARFAFLLAVPVMLGAGGYEALQAIRQPGLGDWLPAIAAGFITAAVVGWLAVRWLLGYLNRHSLYAFAIYCAAAGSVVLIINYLP
jgi:undecaprenyl-diphosphatase